MFSIIVFKIAAWFCFILTLDFSELNYFWSIGAH